VKDFPKPEFVDRHMSSTRVASIIWYQGRYRDIDSSRLWVICPAGHICLTIGIIGESE